MVTMVKFGNLKISSTPVTEDLYFQVMGQPGGASSMPALVTPEEASAFIERLNSLYGSDYRLPTFQEYNDFFDREATHLFNEDRSRYVWSSLDSPTVMPVACKEALKGIYDPAGNIPQIVKNDLTRRQNIFPYLFVGGSYTHEYATCRPDFYQTQAPMERMSFRICCP